MFAELTPSQNRLREHRIFIGDSHVAVLSVHMRPSSIKYAWNRDLHTDDWPIAGKGAAQRAQIRSFAISCDGEILRKFAKALGFADI